MPRLTYSSAAVPRQTDHPVLGGDVGSDAAVTGQRADPGIVDDRATALSSICRSSCLMQVHRCFRRQG
jgi:hypothetical protein